MNLKKIAAAVAILGTIGLGTAAPAAAGPLDPLPQKPHHDCDCDGDWGYDGGWNGGWNGGWYPGKWINGCVTGPYGHVSFCW
jgi:hypothetical protein